MHDSITDPLFRHRLCLQFLGVPGRIYSLISDSVVDISLNALFSVAYASGVATDVDTLVVTPYTARGTWIKAIGLKVTTKLQEWKAWV